MSATARETLRETERARILNTQINALQVLWTGGLLTNRERHAITERMKKRAQRINYQIVVAQPGGEEGKREPSK